MAFRAVMRRLRRRWWILAVGGVATLVLAAFVHSRPPIFQAQAVIGGLAPVQPTTPNQLVNVVQGELALMQAVSNNLNSPDNQARMRADGVVPDYTLSMRNTGTSETPAYGLPTVIVQATSSDPNAALRSVGLLMDLYRSQLAQMQISLQVEPSQLVTTAVNVAPYVADASGRPSQAVVGAILLGVVFTIPFTLWCDRWLQRVAPGGLLIAWRSRRRAPRPPAGAES